MMKTKQYYINNLNVLYEDNHLIVIEKPINVLSQKDETNDFDINEIVKDYLKEKYQKEIEYSFDEETWDSWDGSDLEIANQVFLRGTGNNCYNIR